MKLLILFGLVLIHQIAADGGEGVVASMDSGVAAGTTTYEKFMKSTYNSKFFIAAIMH